jgi:hypothetical protein
MKEIVVIPACSRPELLAWCLRRLSEAPTCPNILICADTKANLEEIEYVRDRFFPAADILSAKHHLQVHSGCWNILNAIKVGATFAESVYLIEEDVMIFPKQFFEWHRSQTDEASCGRKLANFPYYTNPGSLLRRPLLRQLIPHITDEYFKDTAAYCESNFPPAPWTSTLDDGLIRRVMEWHGFDAAFPPSPVCAHQGFHWYGKADIVSTAGQSLDEKIENLPKMHEKILTSTDPRFTRYCADFEPFL